MLIQNINSNPSSSKLVTLEVFKSLQSQKNQIIHVSNRNNCPNRIQINASSLSDKKSDVKSTSKLLQDIQSRSRQQEKEVMRGRMLKSSSQPKIRTFKQQVLKIPKVKQMLEKDKFVFIQDIQKRLQLIGDLKNENFQSNQVLKLNQLRRPVQKSKKNNLRHKTSYKIPLTRNNIHHLNNLIQDHISHNQRFKNQEFVFLSQKDYKQPFDLKKLQFMDQINPLKKKYKQKFPQLKQGVLSKNKLLLQHVILNRNVKREMKLDEKKKKTQSETEEFKQMAKPFH